MTTGPVTVPLLLALGLGVANTRPAADQEGDDLSGFGIITLASLYPVTMVLILACILRGSMSPDTEAAFVAAYYRQLDAQGEAGTQGLADKPVGEIATASIQSIVPLAAFVLLVLRASSTPLPRVTVPEVMMADGDFGLAAGSGSRSNGGVLSWVWVKTSSVILSGLCLCLVGIFVLNLGLARGLASLAQQVK